MYTVMLPPITLDELRRDLERCVRLPDAFKLHVDVVVQEAPLAALKKRSLEALQQLLPADVRTYCSVETLVTEGVPAREILKAASARAADVIVMGVQGRNALDRIVFGSNTHAVIRATDCPVLTVRCPRESAVSAS